MIRSLDPQDTIAAIASPPGPAFRGIVRVTGPKALEVVSGLIRGNGEGQEPVLVPAMPVLSGLSGGGREVAGGSFRRPQLVQACMDLEGLSGTVPVLLGIWPGPRTYTGQPLVEIHATGSRPILDLMLASLLAKGARLAEPGEFTLRAFLSGRIDLTQAEAVLGVIDAGSRTQLDVALRQLAGGLAGPIQGLRDRLLDLLAHMEAGLDFDDEPDVDVLAREQLGIELNQAAEVIADLADRLTDRDRPDRRPRVVLAGPPNAGKSMLFNALAGNDQAIVSDVAGTTRDYLSCLINCDGIEIELIDTAGLELVKGEIQGQAQAFRQEQVKEAELVVTCRPVDVTQSLTDDSGGLLVVTKTDLSMQPHGFGLQTSAAKGEGIDELKRAIADRLRSTNAGDLPAGTAARCRASLVHASESLRSARDSLAVGAGDELVSIDLRQAIDNLGEVLGLEVDDEVLDRIFRRFCIGK